MNPNDVSPAKLRKVMDQVNQLLLLADDPGATPAESERARERAERLMFLYKIQEASLDAEEKMRMGIRPMSAKWRVAPLRSEFSRQYSSMANYVVHHIDAMAVQSWEHEDGVTWITFQVYGFESDLAYGESLWNGIRIAFKQKLEPVLDPSLSDEANVFAMRNAGMERIRIAEIMGFGTTGSATAKVTKLFKQACAARGENANVLLGKGNSVKTYRSSYASAFADEMWNRLWKMRTARGQESHTLVLASRKDEIMELLYTDHPSLRPRPVDPNAPMPKVSRRRMAKPKERPVNYAAADRGREAARSVDIGAAGGRRLQD